MKSTSTLFQLFLISFLLYSCKQEKKEALPFTGKVQESNIKHAKGFQITKQASGLTILTISSPWAEAEEAFTYALIPKDKMASMTLNRDAYDAIIPVPVEKIVVTSTTHIPALEALGVSDKYRSSTFITTRFGRWFWYQQSK